MSWIEELYQTYENNLEHVANQNDPIPLLPLFHSMQNAQIHVVLDGNSNFQRASVVTKGTSQTIIPATEDSAGRAGAKIAPHPLCDTLQYVAGDYLAWGGNPEKKKNESGFDPYIMALRGWVNWSNNHKLRSLYEYLCKKQLITDLVAHKVLFGDGKMKQLAKAWTESGEAPPIFNAIRKANKKGQFEAFVRFSVEIPGDMPSELWKDPVLQKSWSEYYMTLLADTDICMVTGEKTGISNNHPKGIRYPGDGAKLVSSNDTEGFTYLGRFTNDKEACCIGIKITQEAHSALRWLIPRQGWRDGEQAIVAWAVSGVDIPDLFADTASLLSESKIEIEPITTSTGDTAQDFGKRLSKMIAGYSVELGSTENIVVMGLDSATPGRMAITFYRELTGSELLERVQAWHMGCCWLQRFGKEKVFVGAPAPRDIAEAAYGRRLDDKLRKATIERLLPCIVDGMPIPRDLVDSCISRVSNRNGIENWEWEKSLGIACALYRYRHKERGYTMALDESRTTRDYLYGRLLALADSLEQWALNKAQEDRQTNATRLMHRFAERPYSTWKTIELSLAPYKARLGNQSQKRQALIDKVHSLFETPEDYTSNKKLSGEFLLGYHCQREALRPTGSSNVNENEPETEINQ
jgi:CRISPR-associated protein Csd1